MKVILLKDVPKVGKKDEVKEVNQGYALNFLIPKKLGRAATNADIQALKNKLKEREVHQKVAKELIHQTVKSLDGKTIEIVEKANNQGHLFSKVHKKEIVAAIKEKAGATIESDWITLEEEPIKEVGEHELLIKAEGSKAKVQLVVSVA